MALTHIITPIVHLAEDGRLPDGLLRMGIRSLLAERLKSMTADSCEVTAAAFSNLLNSARQSPVAALPEKANQQHYEVPAEFFSTVLGARRKYSCCYFESPDATLDDAEVTALKRTCEHAQLENGQSILELGCGWGSLSLWMAEKYPDSSILAISNSASQRLYILDQIACRGIRNLEVRTCDINDFQEQRRFDRVVSVEMFEHVRNHELLMQRIASWLLPSGKLFVHIFCHNRYTYLFEDSGPSSWMARYFFSGGMMPGRDLLMHFQQHLALEQTWNWNGQHYAKTAEAWLARMDAEPQKAAAILKDAYGADWRLWRQRWRIFFMACAELFAWKSGNEWFVAHYLFQMR